MSKHSEELTTKLRELVNIVNNSEQNAIATRVLSLRKDYHVLLENYQQLIEYLGNNNLQFSKTVSPKERIKRIEKIGNEISRLLHNYLASAVALVDHVRHDMRKWYANSEFAKEYQSEIIQKFVGNTTVEFVEGLRNYTLHYRHPKVILQTPNPSGLDTLHIGLSKSNLLLWDGWKGNKGEKFLNSSNDIISIPDFIVAYQQLVYEYHGWVGQKLETLHESEIKWLINKQKEIDLVAQELKQSVEENR